MGYKEGITVEIFNNIRRLFHIINEQSHEVERSTGLTGPQTWAIKVIAEASPVRVSDLAKKLFLHPATVVGILDRLETKSLILRTRSKEDRRVVTVELTPAGHNLIKQSPDLFQTRLTTGLESLESTDLVVINRSLDLLIQIIDTKAPMPLRKLSNAMNMPQDDLDGASATDEIARVWLGKFGKYLVE
ncbi:MAG TPA: MarR family transcriptional regulator [Deltaproteobacteria bacterium]|nr:MarR family transcriptional regulator [Deltaproteobacteria bacterium]HQB39765.1 MarR family transcriptional regulator [Deltaproteobacteria bacterium]